MAMPSNHRGTLSLVFGRSNLQALLAKDSLSGLVSSGSVVCLALDVLPKHLVSSSSNRFSSVGHQTTSNIRPLPPSDRQAPAAGVVIINGLGLAAGTQTLSTIEEDVAATLLQGGCRCLLIQSLSDLLLYCGRNETLLFLERLRASLQPTSTLDFVCVLHESLHEVKEINFWIDIADSVLTSVNGPDGALTLKRIPTQRQGVQFQSKSSIGNDEQAALASEASSASTPVIITQAHKSATFQNVDDFEDEDDNPDDDLDL